MSKHSNPVVLDAVVGEAGVWIVHQDLQKTLIGSRDDAVEPGIKHSVGDGVGYYW